MRLSSLSIVLPCYREESNLAHVVRELHAVARPVASDLEILVVDDGSDDRTSEVARHLRADLRELRLIQHPSNRGYGAAIRTGIASTTKDRVLLMDGDGQIDPSALRDAARSLAWCDAIIGYRAPRADSFERVMLGRAWTRLINGAFNLAVRDANCAFKLLPGPFLRALSLRSAGALVSAEILACASRAGLSVIEIPVPHRPRNAGRATGAHPKVVARAMFELLRLRGEILTQQRNRSASFQTPKKARFAPDTRRPRDLAFNETKAV